MTVWVTIKKVPLPFALPSSSSSRPFFLPFFLLVDMFVCDRVSCFPGQPQTLFVTENDLKLLILLALSPKCCDYCHVVLCLALWDAGD